MAQLLLSKCVRASVVRRPCRQSRTGYPEKPIRVVVGFPPGGGADVVARLVAQNLQQTWRHTVVVDNRPGAGGNVGTEIVAKSNPGWLYASAHESGTGNGKSKPHAEPAVQTRAGILRPITLIASAPNAVVIPVAFPATGIREFIALARASREAPELRILRAGQHAASFCGALQDDGRRSRWSTSLVQGRGVRP